VDFIDFPMPTEGDIDEVECVKFIQAMESRLRPPPEPIDMASEEIYMIFKGRTDEVEERLVALRPKRFEWLMQWIKEHMAEFEGPILKQNDYEDADAYTGKNKVSVRCRARALAPALALHPSLIFALSCPCMSHTISFISLSKSI